MRCRRKQRCCQLAGLQREYPHLRFADAGHIDRRGQERAGAQAGLPSPQNHVTP
jgi:hypothetical protein